MALLKQKIQAATLMETLVATTIIIVVFVIASLVLNTTFKAVVQHNTVTMENTLDRLQYLYTNEQLQLPYYETEDTIEFSVITETIDGISYVVYEAKKTANAKTLVRYQVDE